MKNFIISIILTLGSIGSCLTQTTPTNLLIYAALEPDQLQPIKTAFEAEHPNIKLNWVRAPIGTITARVLAESNNPKADLVYGLGGTSLIQLEKRGLLMSHTPEESKHLNKKFKSKNNTWLAYDAFLSVVCYNVIEGDKLKVKKPVSIEDLTKSEFKGRIQMPDPNISGTGFMIVAGILDIYGDLKGWDYLDKLDKNMATYLPSGSTPCTQAANGEFLMGWSVDVRASKLIASGAPIEFLIPSEGIFWDLEGAAILASTKNEVAAKVLFNWIYSKNAMQIYGKDYAVLGRPDVESNAKYHPYGRQIVDKLIDINIEQMSEKKDSILSEWNKRYRKSK